MDSNKTDPVINFNCTCGSLHTSPVACSCELAGGSKGTTCMDGVAGRRQDNFIRWCHGCKHEVPDWILSDRCDWCGGDVVEIGGKQDEN